jgi:hypothetical protein
MHLRRHAAYTFADSSSALLCAAGRTPGDHFRAAIWLLAGDDRHNRFLSSRAGPAPDLVSANNITTGAVMTILKKSGARNHRSVGQDTGLPAPGLLSRSGRTGCSKIKLEFARENTTSFAEDFYEEHSLSCVSIIPTVISTRSEYVGPAGPRNPYANNANPPNCVYVG